MGTSTVQTPRHSQRSGHSPGRGHKTPSTACCLCRKAAPRRKLLSPPSAGSAEQPAPRVAAAEAGQGISMGQRRARGAAPSWGRLRPPEPHESHCTGAAAPRRGQLSHLGERSPRSPISPRQLTAALNTNKAPLVSSGTWPGGSAQPSPAAAFNTKQTPTWKPPAPLGSANLFPLLLLLSLQTGPSVWDESRAACAHFPREKSSREGAGKRGEHRRGCSTMKGMRGQAGCSSETQGGLMEQMEKTVGEQPLPEPHRA